MTGRHSPDQPPAVRTDRLDEDGDSEAVGFYDIEADWTLMTTCNYRCEYCFWSPQQLGRRISPPATVEALASFFVESGLTWLLHLTGGEPFLYPRFVDLCRQLAERHWLSINTNADVSHSIERFVRSVDPERVLYINTGLHIEQRRLRNRLETFLTNVRLLQSAGFTVFASSVMRPDLLGDDFKAVWKYCNDQGVVVIPKSFQGAVAGIEFPEGYSEHDREVFREYAALAASHYDELFAAMPEPPTVNPLLDADRFLHGLPDHRGSACAAGHRFVRIRHDGEIRRCGPGDVLGNVVTGTFERRPGPSICEWLECPYFCEKHVIAGATDRESAVALLSRGRSSGSSPRRS